MTGRVLFVFLDGVGIGPADAEVNPFLRAGERIPTLQRLMGGNIPTLERPRLEGRDGTSFPLDATLDVDGLPQSGTGQVALLTGASAAELYGRHFGPWTPSSLRALVEERSLLRRAVDGGRRVAFANAYPNGWPGPKRERRLAATPLAARGAGLMVRHEHELGRGEAVSSEIVNDGWRSHLGHGWLPEVTPEEAGGNLARIANRADLTLFAHYATDTVGHRGGMADAVEALVRVDRFLEGVVGAMRSDALLVIGSDHGNLEDVRAGHTRNPALGVAAGPGAERAGALGDLRDVASFVLSELGIERSA